VASNLNVVFSKIMIKPIKLSAFICIALMALDFNVLDDLFSALRYAQTLLEKGFNFVSFDFAGSGNSEG
jgi:hypothetical protein